MKTGAALPTVLLAAALTSALAVGITYVSRQMVGAARISARGIHLQPKADAALIQSLASWDSIARATQPVGTTVALAGASRDSTLVWVTRLTGTLYLVVAEVSGEQPPMIRRRSAFLATTYEGAPEPVRARAFFWLP